MIIQDANKNTSMQSLFLINVVVVNVVCNWAKFKRP